jgi:hypothetical protein
MVSNREGIVMDGAKTRTKAASRTKSGGRRMGRGTMIVIQVGKMFIRAVILSKQVSKRSEGVDGIICYLMGTTGGGWEQGSRENGRGVRKSGDWGRGGAGRRKFTN